MNLSTVLMLAIATKAVVDYLVRPIRKLLETPPEQRNGVFYLSIVTPYLSFVAGFFVAYVARINAFATFLPDAPVWLTLGLTSALVGGGASMVYEIMKALREWSEKLTGVVIVDNEVVG